MMTLRALRHLPMLIKAPAFAALLMIAVSAVISERVLSRLSDNQQQHLALISDTFLDGLSSALLPAVQRRDIWEAYDAIDRAGRVFQAIRPKTTVLTGADGNIIAANDPKAFPPFAGLPAEFAVEFAENRLIIDEARRTAFARKDIVRQGRHLGTIFSAFDISQQIQERRDVLNTLIWTNSFLAVLFAGLGYWVLRRLLEPVNTLSEYFSLAANHASQAIPDEEFPPEGSEFRSLFQGYNALVSAEQERSQLEKQLYDEERLASLGRLASGMAHEINNPLCGMFSALGTLERHGHTPEVRGKTIRLLKRGLSGIRDVVSSALLTYRPPKAPKPLLRRDLEDIRLLLRPELRRKNISLDWRNEVKAELPVDSTPVRQVLLNLLLNACSANASGGAILCVARPDAFGIELSVTDNGPGFPLPALEFLNAKTSASAPIADAEGLGLWIVRRLTAETGGIVEAANLPEGGASITVRLPALKEPLQNVA